MVRVLSKLLLAPALAGKQFPTTTALGNAVLPGIIAMLSLGQVRRLLEHGIAPGVAMMAQALHEGTAKLPRVAPRESTRRRNSSFQGA